MDKIEQKQAVLVEEVDPIKGIINEVKGSVDEVMCALANLTVRENEEQKGPP